MFLYDASMRYQAAGVPLVILAGTEYGSGSSRDWAAKGTRLLGVRAVIAQSYERIHRSNLVGMGVLPLQFLPGESADVAGPDGPRGAVDIAGLGGRPGAAPGAAGRGPRSATGRALVRRHLPPRRPHRGGLLPPGRHPAGRAAPPRGVGLTAPRLMTAAADGRQGAPSMIGGRQPLRGNKPGDRRVRVERPHAPYFRYTGKGVLTAKAAASAPTTPLGRSARAHAADVHRAAPGQRGGGRRAPVQDQGAGHLQLGRHQLQRLRDRGDPAGAARRRGVAALAFSVPVAIGVAILLSVVAISYRQVCMAYPTGGGSYSVSKANFGRLASLVAASALLIDYILTVAVSISSASEQIVAAHPGPARLSRWRSRSWPSSLVTLGNLRGLRESGNIFAAPDVPVRGRCALLMIGLGACQVVVLRAGRAGRAHRRGAAEDLAGVALLLLLLRAFASGAVALTGVEAIATGVPAFKPPESRNAATTLAVMAVLLAHPVRGHHVPGQLVRGACPTTDVTVIAQVAGHVFGDRLAGLLPVPHLRDPHPHPRRQHLLQRVPTAGARSWPRTASSPASSGCGATGSRSPRASWSWAAWRSLLVIAFGGDTHALIPLYAVGVFIDFTISQSGMVRHWLRDAAAGLSLPAGHQRASVPS